MKKLLLFFLLLISSCKDAVYVQQQTDVYKYTQEQFDSLCNAENLDPNLEEWIVMKSKGYESGMKYTRYAITRGDTVTFKTDLVGNTYFVKILKLK